MEKSKNQYSKFLIPTLFIVVLAVSFYLIAKSPIGKALTSLLGTLAGIAASIGQQFKTCNESGYFNVKKGCYLGIFGIIGFIGPILFASLWKMVGSPTKNDLVNRTAETSGEKPNAILEETLPEGNPLDIIENSAGKEITLSSKIAGWKKAFYNRLQRKFNKSLDKQDMTPKERQEAIEDVQKQVDASKNDIDEQAKQDDSNTDPDEVAEDVDTSTEFFDA